MPFAWGSDGTGLKKTRSVMTLFAKPRPLGDWRRLSAWPEHLGLKRKRSTLSPHLEAGGGLSQGDILYDISTLLSGRSLGLTR